jgi:putative oxidoreductase
MESATNRVWHHRMLGLLRIVTGFLFIAHGGQKLLNFPPSGKPPMPLDGWMATAGYLELIGGALILIGLLTRPVAFILAGEMAVAYFKAHAPNDFWPINNKGELSVLLSFLFLYFTFVGAGAFSIDSLFRRKAATESEHRGATADASGSRASPA